MINSPASHSGPPDPRFVPGLRNFMHVGLRKADPPSRPASGADPETLFNSGIPCDLIAEIRNHRVQVSYAEMQAAWERSIWQGMKVVFEDATLETCDCELFAEALPHIRTASVKYIASYFVCRNFATAFVAIVDGVLGIGTVGKTYDFAGHHSYNVVFLETEGELQVHGVEPQTDRFIEHLDSARHYTGTGIAFVGG